MILPIEATSGQEIDRLRDLLARHVEVANMKTIGVLREWKNGASLGSAKVESGD